MSAGSLGKTLEMCRPTNGIEETLNQMLGETTQLSIRLKR